MVKVALDSDFSLTDFSKIFIRAEKLPFAEGHGMKPFAQLADLDFFQVE